MPVHRAISSCLWWLRIHAFTHLRRSYAHEDEKQRLRRRTPDFVDVVFAEVIEAVSGRGADPPLGEAVPATEGVHPRRAGLQEGKVFASGAVFTVLVRILECFFAPVKSK